MTAGHPPANRLANEASPYLRQHAGNPVDWFPWGEEAFARARAEDKPIFLSIGYSTCHWCHVMAHESFEDPEIAALLNEHFVCIKLDREERPDVDRVYMTFVQATTGHGGWPMSVWLGPDLAPFYGGTYFPPEDRWGRPGFASILQALARLWREERERVLQQGAHAAHVLQQFAGRLAAAGGDAGEPAAGAEEGARAAIARALQISIETYDEQWGGFGHAPKFPRPAGLSFLWHVHTTARERGDAETAAEARRLAEGTLRGMISGGIHDQLGGGFHRYSVDATWHVPHFEKMLYDQAQIVCALLEAQQATCDATFGQAARATLDYVRRDLAAPGGAFYSAEDADSARPDGTHGEGAFYVWTTGEIREALGPERTRVFLVHHEIEENGNAPEGADPHDEFAGRNIVLARRSIAATAAAVGRSEVETQRVLDESRRALFAARCKRPRPHRDEKVIAAWNGLMISAFARAAQVLGDPALAAPAVEAAKFLREGLWDAKAGILRRSWCDGRVGPEGVAEDYAFLVRGMLDLHEATFDAAWLRWAVELQAAQDRLFWDDAGGGYFSSSGRDHSVLLRMKEDHDGAEPAPSSVAALNLLRLGRVLGDPAALVRARATMDAFAGTWQRAPHAMPAMLVAVSESVRPPRQIVLAGRPGAADFEALAGEVRRRALPGRVLLAVDGGAGQAWLAERAPWLRDMKPVAGQAAAYVCEDFTCRMPITDPAELGRALDRDTKTS
jgi:uncharacterized protein